MISHKFRMSISVCGLAFDCLAATKVQLSRSKFVVLGYKFYICAAVRQCYVLLKEAVYGGSAKST